MGIDYYVVLLRRVIVSLDLLQISGSTTFPPVGRKGGRSPLWNYFRRYDVCNDAGLALLHLVLCLTRGALGGYSLYPARVHLGDSLLLFRDTRHHAPRGGDFVVLLCLRDVLRRLLSDDE